MKDGVGLHLDFRSYHPLQTGHPEPLGSPGFPNEGNSVINKNI